MYVPGLLPGWRLMRLPEVPETFKLLDVFRPLEVLKLLGALEYNNLRPYSILLLYSLTYNNDLSKRVDNYTMLPPRYYINGLIDPNKINKFLKT